MKSVFNLINLILAKYIVDLPFEDNIYKSIPHDLTADR
jgi:hypothetical protein